jgi:uncharacterized phage protein (TIGR01671 family)
MEMDVQKAEKVAWNVPCQIADGVAKNFIREVNKMREIKFRVWDAENKEMFYPKKIEWNNQGELRFFNKNNMWNIDMVLMQFTGLKDKNGKDILEGDILITPIEPWESSPEIIKVYWSTGELAWFAISTESDDSLMAWDTNASEIIGNIYESPELLKGGE